MKYLAIEAKIKCVLNVAEDSPPVGHRCGFPPRMHGQFGSPRATGNLHVPSSAPRPGFPSGVRRVGAYITGPMELPPHIYAPDSFTQTLLTNIKCLCFNSEGYFKSEEEKTVKRQLKFLKASSRNYTFLKHLHLFEISNYI